MSIANLAAALTKAQAQFQAAVKDKNNPFFKAKYADLGSVVEAIRIPLAENGLAYVQISHDKENAAAIETLIVHSSGEQLSCGVVSVPVSKGDAQGYGSAMTYARRYSLSAAFGVTTEDDDGNAAAGAKPTPNTAKQVAKDEFDGLEVDEQEFQRSIAMNVKAYMQKGKVQDAVDYIASQNFDSDKLLAFWSLLEPGEANAIKKRQQGK